MRTPASVAVSTGGVCLWVQGGVCLWVLGGVCLWVLEGYLPVGPGGGTPCGSGGVSASGSRGIYLWVSGVSVCWSGGVCLWACGMSTHPLDIYPQTLCPGGVYASGSGRGVCLWVREGCLPLGVWTHTPPHWVQEGVCLWVWEGCLPLGLGGVSASGFGGCLPLGLGCVYHNPWTPPPGHRHRPPSPQPPFHPLIEWLTDRCKNITMPQTSFAGGKDVTFICCEFTISCPFRTDKRVSHYHWRKCQVTIVLSH